MQSISSSAGGTVWELFIFFSEPWSWAHNSRHPGGLVRCLLHKSQDPSLTLALTQKDKGQKLKGRFPASPLLSGHSQCPDHDQRLPYDRVLKSCYCVCFKILLLCVCERERVCAHMYGACVCMCAWCVGMCTTAFTGRPEDNFVELVLSFHLYVRSRIQADVASAFPTEPFLSLVPV